jgi:hypothetical protein
MIAGAAMALILAFGAGAQDGNDGGRSSAGPRVESLRVGVSAMPQPTEAVAGSDTVRVRRRAVRLSEAYYTRQKVHKIASYAILPMFALEYAAGSQLYSKGSSAPGWAQDYHGVIAGGVAGLFAINTFTGSLNWWETRKQEKGRTWRTVHAALMLAADAGFALTGALAEDAEESGDDRKLHRTVAVTSMSVASISYLMMLKPLRRD